MAHVQDYYGFLQRFMVVTECCLKIHCEVLLISLIIGMKQVPSLMQWRFFTWSVTISNFIFQFLFKIRVK